MSSKFTDSERISKSCAMARLYTDSVHEQLVSLLTTPLRFKEATDRFQASHNALQAGDTVLGATCEADRKELDRQFSLLNGMAKVAAITDANVPEKLGLLTLVPKTTAAAVVALAKPGDFRMSHGQNSGEMIAKVQYMKSIKNFEVWGCEGDPNVEQNWRLLAASPYCKGVEVKGLTPGTKYWFRIRAVRKGQEGPWSNYIALIAI